jgi:hypothetical protein
LSLTARAQQTVAPTTEQVGPVRGTTVDDYTVNNSFELGWRFKAVGGDDGMYRSVVNYGNGLRLLGSSLSIYSKDGHGRYFDEIVLNTIGLGNDNYQSAVLRVQKNQLYRYDLTWRLNAYYNPGLDIAGGLHFMDTTQRLQDHNLTLLPQSKVRFRVGYSRVTDDGPALSTAQEFDANGFGLPVFMNVKRQWNEYRLGADADWHGLHFVVTRQWDFFKDDSPYSSAGVVAAGTATDQTVLQQFHRSSPIHGSNPGWLGYLFTRRKLWALDARLTYVSGSNNFALDESASGISQFGGTALRQIAVGGDAKRPDLAGNFAFSAFPTEHLTIVNSSAITSNRIDGQSSYSEVNTGINLGTTIFFRYLGVRTFSNETDVNYRVNDWMGFYARYAYSDRQVRTIEGSQVLPFDSSFTNDLYEVSNHLNTYTGGLRLRPLKGLTANIDGEIGRANNPLTPISDRDYHTINGRVQYRAKNLQLSAVYRQAYNLNAPLSFSYYSSHARTYSANGSWALRNWFSVDASYTKLHLDTLSSLAFFAGTGFRTQLQTGYDSIYISNIYAGSMGAHFGVKRADVFVGYSITKDTGDGRATAVVPPGTTDPIQGLLSSVQTFPLTYESPLARFSIKITPKIRVNIGWQYYVYHEDFGVFNEYQNFHAHTGFSSILWSF